MTGNTAYVGKSKYSRARKAEREHLKAHPRPEAGQGGHMDGAPVIPSEWAEVPGAGLQSQWVPPATAQGAMAGEDAPDDNAGDDWHGEHETAHDHGGCAVCTATSHGMTFAGKGASELDTHVVGDPGNLARGAMVHGASHPTMTMPGPMNTGRPVSYERLELKGSPASDGHQTLRQDLPATKHPGTITVETRDLRGASVTQPAEFDRPPNPAAASNASMPSTVHPSLPTGPSHVAHGVRWTRAAPGEAR